LATLFFSYFAGVIVVTSVLVIALRNPVYSALALLIMFFHDAGEALGFLTEALECEIKWCMEAAVRRDKGQRDRLKTRESFPGDVPEYRRKIIVLLHLALCECGCQRFFLWEGNWHQRERKYLNDKHRMDFHNSRNVIRKKKKHLASQRRSEGRYQ